MDALRAYPWPGNIRELENLVERVVVFADGPIVEWEDLPERIRNAATAGRGGTASFDEPLPLGDLKTTVRHEARKVARKLILQALEHTNGNISQAARLLGMSRKGLQLKMKELGLRQGG